MTTKANPSVKFSGTVYDQDDCLQTTGMTHGGDEVRYRCGGYIKKETGDDEILLPFSIVVENDDTAVIQAFARGSTGTAEYHPGGDTTGNIEISTTKATVMNRDIQGDPAGPITLDIILAWDDATDATAA